ncbi:hypothetical protein Brms1b_010082 [Colletotrichum noveboracense]|nr:hypothetical protein Brms1b_010082 [Colletotrichum noveboracense]
MFSFKDLKFLKIYIVCISVYVAAAIAAVVWTYQGPEVNGGYTRSRVFRTPDELKVNQLYSGLALSALLAPAGMLVQWIMHDFRHLRLFALTAQRPVSLADLDKIGDDSSAWTLRILGKYSWWYAVMQAALIVIRTSIVPVGTLMLTTGVFVENRPGFDVVGLPILPSDDSSVRRLANAMGWDGNGTFSQTLNDNDNFLAQTVYTFVGNIVSQSALVDVFSGVIGPIPTHNLTFNSNTTYNGLLLYHWDANCEAALDVPYTTSLNGSNATYTFTMPDSSTQSINVSVQKRESQSLRLWNSRANTSINGVPISGTTYFISAGPSSALNSKALTESNDTSLTQTKEGHWISRSRCTPEFRWEVGSCMFNGTLMTNCEGKPNTNTTALDTDALDKLADYMTAIPWWISNEQLQIIDKTIDTLYSIPTAQDWGHFFGNIAQSIAAISTAGYFGTATVPVVTAVSEDVYIMRTVVLWVVLAMLSAVLIFSCLDIYRSKSRGLPFRAATFLAIANAVRGPWWDQELHGSCAAPEVAMQKRSSSSVSFGVDGDAILWSIVTGATGILGREIVKVLSSNPEEWLKTRSKKEDFPQNVVQRHLDLCATPEEMARELQGVEADYVFFAAYLEQDTEAKASKVNGDMLDAFLKALVLNDSASKIKRIILVCGAKQYGASRGRAVRVKLLLPSAAHPSRLLRSPSHPGISWVVTYPNEVIGFAKGNFMNFGTAVAIYAAVQRELGSNELVFPGAEDFYTRVTTFSDARLHGQFCRWAALAPEAANLSFNVVNGDAASWQDLWPRVARYFSLHVPADQFTRPAPAASERKLAARTPFSLSAEAIGVATSSVSGEQKQEQSHIRQRIDLVEWSRSGEVQEAWRRLAAREGLDGDALDRASWAFAGFAWGPDYDVVLSMSRARQLGWTGYVDSWDGFETVFRGLADAKVIPKQKW